MNVLRIRQRVFDGLSVLGLAAVTVGLLVFPTELVAAAENGVELCFNVLIPSLFPFFVISSMVVSMGLADALGSALAPVMSGLFNVGGQCASALILGFIGGYPVGARTVIALYDSGRCSKAEAQRMLAFCNNSGPAFIFGVVGAGIFSSSAVGVILYLTHILASVLVGLIFRNYGSGRPTPVKAAAKSKKTPFPEAFVSSVTSSFSSCLNICGFVIFFTVLIRLLFLSGVLTAASELMGTIFGVFGMDSLWAEKLLTGLIELTSGVWSLKDAAPEIRACVSMAAFMLGWAGLSVHCQVLSFLYKSGLSAGTYILGKLLHGLLSAGLAALVMTVVDLNKDVGVYLADQVGKMTGLGFRPLILASAGLSAAILLIFLLASFIFGKRSGKNDGDAL